jgi:hypothetical protein
VNDTAAAEPAEPVAWPVTVHARWTDPGYTRGEFHVLLGMLAGTAWAVAVVHALGATQNWLLLLFPTALAAWAVFIWTRRRPAALALELSPEGLHLVRTGANPIDLEIPRAEAGWVVAAAATLGAADRIVLLLDEPGNELVRFRGIVAPVEITGTADDGWWTATMPAGTTLATPPTVLPVAALVGEWWPDPAHRLALKGNGARIRWVEPTLARWQAADQSHRRTITVVIVVLLVFLLVGAVRAGSPTSLLAVIPPVAIGIVATLFGVARHRTR